MLKILEIISGKSIARDLVKVTLNGFPEHTIFSARNIVEAQKALEEHADLDAIVVGDILDDEDPKAFFKIIGKMTKSERKKAILFRVGLEEPNADKFIEGYPNGGGFFASVHARTEDSDPNSLISRVKELLGIK